MLIVGIHKDHHASGYLCGKVMVAHPDIFQIAGCAVGIGQLKTFLAGVRPAPRDVAVEGIGASIHLPSGDFLPVSPFKETELIGTWETIDGSVAVVYTKLPA